MLSIALIAAAAAAPPASDPPAPAPAQPAAQMPPTDDSLFEFLGSDDVGDARWWDYLMKVPPAKPPLEASK